VRFDDLVCVADLGPVCQIASCALVQIFGGLSKGRCSFFGLFESVILAFGDDVSFAAIQTTIDVLACRFQDVLGSGSGFGRIGFAVGDELVQFGGQRLAFRLARLRLGLSYFMQAANFRFEGIIASQFEEAQEFLGSFLLGRVGASGDARLCLGGDRAQFRPRFGISQSRWRFAASHEVLDQSAEFGATFRTARFFGFEGGQDGIGGQFGLGRFATRVETRIHWFRIGVDATKNG